MATLTAPLLSCALTFSRRIGFSKLASKVSVDNADALSKILLAQSWQAQDVGSGSSVGQLGQTHLHPRDRSNNYVGGFQT